MKLKIVVLVLLISSFLMFYLIERENVVLPSIHNIEETNIQTVIVPTTSVLNRKKIKTQSPNISENIQSAGFSNEFEKEKVTQELIHSEINSNVNDMLHNKAIINSINEETFINWLKTLIFYTYVSSSIHNNEPYDSNLINNIELNLNLLPDDLKLPDSIHVNYVNELRYLAGQLKNGNYKSEDNANIYRKILKLSYIAKKHTNNIAYSKMRKYFKSNEYSIEDKIKYSKKYIAMKDKAMMERAKEYFEFAISSQPNNENTLQLQLIINDLSKD